MLNFPPGIQVFRALDPVDMRKSFDGWSAAVQTVFARDVLDGHLFLFLNRRCDRIQILGWDRDGLALGAKRLEIGSYEIPPHGPEAKHLRLDATQLALLFSGVQLSSVKHRRRSVLQPPTSAALTENRPHQSSQNGA